MEYSRENLVDDVFDALETANKAHALLPPLPPDMKPVHIRILRAIKRVRDDTGRARVSDINRMLGYLLPNTTRYINELAELKMVEKCSSAEDKRVVLVQTMELGEQCIRNYILNYHDRLQEALLAIGESDCRITIQTIGKIYQTMKKIYQDRI